jgi:hypothetical protein
MILNRSNSGNDFKTILIWVGATDQSDKSVPHPKGKALLPPQRTGNAHISTIIKIFKLETVIYYGTVSLSARVPDIQRNSPLNTYSSLRRIRACRAIFLVSALLECGEVKYIYFSMSNRPVASSSRIASHSRLVAIVTPIFTIFNLPWLEIKRERISLCLTIPSHNGKLGVRQPQAHRVPRLHFTSESLSRVFFNWALTVWLFETKGDLAPHKVRASHRSLKKLQFCYNSHIYTYT